MKVLVIGATGALGRPLVKALRAEGHDVIGTTRSTKGEAAVRAAGADPLILDVLDRPAVLAAVGTVEPDAIIHQATALSGLTGNPRKFDAEFALTNRLRTEGLDNLLEAAGKAGGPRLLAQSYTGWPNAKTGGPVKTEQDPLDEDPPKASSRSLAAIRYLERVLPEAGGIVLRYGAFYGPGTGGADPQTSGNFDALIRKRRFPVIGGGGGVWSFVHIEDAAAATVAALTRGRPGLYNIVDDEPAPVREWLPHLAAALGAKPPRHLPVWLGRLAAGDLGVAMMTRTRGSSNAKAKRELGWTPSRASWRTGFMEVRGRLANSDT